MFGLVSLVLWHLHVFRFYLRPVSLISTKIKRGTTKKMSKIYRIFFSGPFLFTQKYVVELSLLSLKT